MFRRTVFFIFVLLSLLPGSVRASYISLSTTISSKVEGDTLDISVSIVNKGDESAYGVQAEIGTAGSKFLADKVQELGIDQTYQASEQIRLNLQKGKHLIQLNLR
ncbi:hypothetical protein KKH56_00410 [bacterium]|nr:hypothetical protein [bacterium]